MRGGLGFRGLKVGGSCGFGVISGREGKLLSVALGRRWMTASISAASCKGPAGARFEVGARRGGDGGF